MSRFAPLIERCRAAGCRDVVFRLHLTDASTHLDADWTCEGNGLSAVERNGEAAFVALICKLEEVSRG